MNGVTKTDPNTPLILAAQRGHAEVIEALAEAKADFTAINDKTGETILHFILKNGKRNKPGYQR